MTVTKYVWVLLCAILAAMLALPACGDDDDEVDGGDTDVDTDTDADSDADGDKMKEGEACTIMIASAIPAMGVCMKEDDTTCEGGFSAALPMEAGASQNCDTGLDCCSKTDQCEGLKAAVEPALGVIPACTPDTGDGACEQDPGLFNFKVGCPADFTCCLTPIDTGDAGPDASE